MLRALIFITLVGALALMILSLLRRTPRDSTREAPGDDESGEPPEG
jgi:hypothetical protein